MVAYPAGQKNLHGDIVGYNGLLLELELLKFCWVKDLFGLCKNTSRVSIDFPPQNRCKQVFYLLSWKNFHVPRAKARATL